MYVFYEVIEEKVETENGVLSLEREKVIGVFQDKEKAREAEQKLTQLSIDYIIRIFPMDTLFDIQDFICF